MNSPFDEFQKAPDPFDEFSRTQPPAAAVLRTALPDNPDHAAEAVRLARRYPAPADVFLRNLKDVRLQAAVDDADKVLATAPKLRGYVESSPFTAKIVHDDLENMGAVEATLSAIGAAARYVVSAPNTPNTLTGDLGAGVLGANRGASGMLQAAAELPAPMLDWMEANTPEEFAGWRGAIGGNPLRRLAEGAASAGKASGDKAKELSPPQAGLVASGVSSGVQSLVQNLLTLPLALLPGGAPAALGSMSGLTGGQAYQDAREKGLPMQQALPYAASQAAIEFATEKIPVSRLIGDLASNATLRQILTRQLAAEIPGEQVATVLQDLNDWAVLHPEKPFSAYLAERPGAAVQTLIATAVGVGGNVAVMRSIDQAINAGSQQAEQAQRAEQVATQLDALGKLAEASKVRERDADTFEAFVAQATEEGPLQDVFVDARVLMQSGVAEQLAAVSPSVAEQLPAALASGGDVRIPVAEYAARIAGSEFNQGLLDHLKTEPGGFSRTEAREFMQSQGEALQAEVERAMQVEQVQAQAEEVKALVRTQLDTAGRFTGAANEAYAGMVGAFYATTATRLGVPAAELWQRYPLTVSARGQGGAVLEQSALETPAFKAWFGDSKVVDAEGRPLAVYHGTSGDFDTFDRGVAGKGPSKLGFWFTNDPEFAENFGHTLMSAYVVLRNPKVLTHAQWNAMREKHGGDAAFFAALRDEYTAQGFDGVAVPASAEKVGRFDVSVPGVFAAFNPEQIKSAIGNSGTFDPNDPSILRQSARGTFNPDTLAVTLLKGADLSTFLHESGHAFLHIQLDIAARLAGQQRDGASLSEGEAQILADGQALLRWFKVESFEEWYGLDLEQMRPHHEAFARGFEAYLFEGTAPSIELHGLFQRFRAWLVSVYKELKALNVELTDEVRGVMDRLLATDAQIELAQQGRSMLPLFASADQAGMTVDEFAAYQAQGAQATADAAESLQARALRDMQWLNNTRGREIRRLKKQAAETRREVRMDARREVMALPVYRAWQFLTNKLDAADKITLDPQKSDPSVVDPEVDSLLVAIAKLGGIARESARIDLGVHPDYHRTPSGVFGKTVFRKDGGKTAEHMVEALVETRYLLPGATLSDLEDRIDADLHGRTQYSLSHDYSQRGMRPGDGINLDALGAGRLDRLSLGGMDLPAEDVAAVTSLRMTAKDGLHPDVVADLLGFTSGDELVRALAAAEKPADAIEGLTDRYMLERFGDLASPEAIERAADAAIHNDARARFVATEANALAKATGRPKVLAAAAREFAAAMIGRLKVRAVLPGQYAAAEARAAKAAAKASKAGDLATAAAEKRNQLVQAYAAKAAHQARDEVDAGVRYLRKFDKASARKTIDADYLDQIEALLERFDLRQISNKASDRRTSLLAWVEQQRERGLEPDIPEGLLNEAARKPYRELTVEEFRGLIETVQQIEHLGRMKNRLLTDREQRAYEAVRDEIVASVTANAGDRQADTRTPTTNLGRAWAQVRKFGAAHIKAATWARVFDGGKDGGPVWNYLIRPANDRGDQETTLRAEATARLSEILAPLFKTGGRMGGSGLHFPGINRALNREARIAIALNTGNAGNLQRLLGGEGWTVNQVRPVLESLTAAEWQVVQQVWDYMGSFWPEIAAKERRVYGKAPTPVEPQPFTVRTADGQTVSLQGGYYPIKYDPAASQRAEEHADAEGAKRQLQGAYTSATTRRGFTKGRVEEVRERPLLYTLAGLYGGVNDVIHDLAWHEWLIDANRLLKSKSIDAAIRERYGPDAKAQLKAWVQDIAEGDKGAQNAGEAALARLRQGVSVAGLGFNVMSALMQPLGLTQSVVRVGARWVGLGVKQYLAGPVAATRSVNARSSFMANRSRTRFRELNEVRNQVQGETPVRRAINTGAFYMMLRLQQMVDVPTWLGAYEKAVADGNPDDRAAALADQAVIDAQGGGQTKDLSGIERGGPALKLFTVFYSFMNTALNLGVGQTMSARTPAQRGKLAADYLLLYVAPAVLGVILKQALTPGDDDLDDPEKLAKVLLAAQIDFLMGLMVVVREFSDVAKTLTGANDQGRDYTGPAGLRFVTDLGKLAQQAGQGEFDDAFRKAAVNAVGSLFGLPAAQINRTVTGGQALAEGKTDNPAALALGYREE